jgi:hypothetical protein
MPVVLYQTAFLVFLVNLPFGAWRAKVERFSFPWFLAIHLPVPLVVALRVFSGAGWRLATFPVFIGAFFTGQLLGGMMYRGGRCWLDAKNDSGTM